MNYKIIILSIISILTLIIGVSAFTQKQPDKKPLPQIANNHDFINFEPQSVISTIVINKAQKSISYPKISIEQEQENIMDTKSDIYANSYQVFYKIEKANKPTIDVLFEINKQKKNALVEVKNFPAKKSIDITNGTQYLYKNIQTDWVGSITLDNLNISNKICLTLKTEPSTPSQICHTIEESSHA
jgi:hypothetical protein